MSVPVADPPRRDLPPDSPDCFACGQDNPHGLRMRFSTDGERIFGAVEIPPHLRGWSNLAHGGVVATVLDETMAWTTLRLTRRFALTRTLEVGFLRPVRIGQRLQCEGRLGERPDERRVTVRADLRDDQGHLFARGKAEMVLFDREAFAKLGILPEDRLAEVAARLAADIPA